MQLPWIDEEKLTRNHPLIYHYTNASSLNDIFASGGLFATRYSETNDKLELQAAKEIISPFLVADTEDLLPKKYEGLFGRIKREHADIKAFLLDEASKVYEIAIKALPTPPHLTCFSYHSTPHHNKNGLLSMWRSYCNIGDGIALGFNTAKLIEKTYELQKKFQFDLLPIDTVIYGDESEKLQNRLQSSEGLRSLLSRTIEAMITPTSTDGLMTVYLELVVMAAFTKYPDFSDEREIRLVSTVAPDSRSETREKPKAIGSKLIIECCDCLTHILIGPTHNRLGVDDMVRGAIKRARREDIKITHSKTPFRYV